MIYEELNHKIIELRIQLEQKKSQKRKAERAMADIDETVNSIRTRIYEIETNLQETVSNVEKKIKSVKGAQKFKNNHMERVKTVVFGSESAQSITTLRDAEKRAIAEYNSYDELAEKLAVEITKLEKEIELQKHY